MENNRLGVRGKNAENRSCDSAGEHSENNLKVYAMVVLFLIILYASITVINW